MKKLSSLLLSLAFVLTACTTTSSYRQGKMNPGAAGVLKKISTLPAKDDIALHIKEGVKNIRRKKYKTANRNFADGLKLDPSNGTLHFLNGLAHHFQARSGDQSQLDLAETGYTLALRFDPDNYWASYFLGHVFFEQGRYVDAENQFAYAVMFEEDNPEFLRAMSVSSYYNGEPSLSRWAAEKAVQLDDGNPLSWRAASFARAAAGDLRGSRESFLHYQTVSEQTASAGVSPYQSFNPDWNERHMSSRLDRWAAVHQARVQLAQADHPSVFGSGAQSEDKPVDLDSAADNMGGDADVSPPDSSYPSSSTTPDSKRTAGPKLPNMTLVDVVILRVEESRSQAQGVNLLAGIKATLTGTLFAYNRVSGIASGGASANQQTRTIAPTLALAGLEYNLNIWNDGVNKAEVIARPSLLAIEGQPSSFYSGAVLHVQLNSEDADGSVVDVPVGIKMDITPSFLDEETVQVKVHAERSVIEDRDEKLGFTLFSQTAKTSVDAIAVLKFGETLVLSGLTEDEETKAKSGVPFLQNIPGVQYLFSRKTHEETKKSVLILLSPHRARHADEHMTIREARKAIRKAREETKHSKALRKREGLDLRDNVQAAFETMEKRSTYYREFQRGDLRLDEWLDTDSLFGALKRAAGFIWY